MRNRESLFRLSECKWPRLHLIRMRAHRSALAHHGLGSRCQTTVNQRLSLEAQRNSEFFKTIGAKQT
jgi:hypothetical protein